MRLACCRGPYAEHGTGACRWNELPVPQGKVIFRRGHALVCFGVRRFAGVQDDVPRTGMSAYDKADNDEEFQMIHQHCKVV